MGALILIFALAQSALASPVGIVTHIEGNVDIIRKNLPAPETLLLGKSVMVNDIIRTKKGSSLKCMGNQIRDMIEIRHQEMKEVDTDHHERHGFISVGIGFDTAMACGIV